MKVVSKVLSRDRYSSDETLGFTRQSLICMFPNAPEDLDPEVERIACIQQITKGKSYQGGRLKGEKVRVAFPKVRRCPISTTTCIKFTRLAT